MSDVISFFDLMWSLMWFPLRILSTDYIIIVCPLLLLIVTCVFGSVFNLFRGF